MSHSWTNSKAGLYPNHLLRAYCGPETRLKPCKHIQGQLHGCVISSITQGPHSEGPMAGLISIITSYIFELVFYKWSPRDNAVCAQVEVTSTICISSTCHSQFSPSPATSHIDFMLLYRYRTQMDPQYVEFQKTQSESRISTLHLQLSKVKVEVS